MRKLIILIVICLSSTNVEAGKIHMRIYHDSYYENIIRIFRGNIVAYYQMNETYGTSMRDTSISNNHSTYIFPTLNQSGFESDTKSVLFSGGSSYSNLYSTSMNTALNKAEGTALFWIKLSDTTQWIDGTARRIFQIYADANNRMFIDKNIYGGFDFYYVAGGTSNLFSSGAFLTSRWLQIGLSWSKSNNSMKAYINGFPVKTVAGTGLGTWVGNMHATYCYIGSRSTFVALNSYITNLIILNHQASDASILQAYPFNYDRIYFAGDSRTTGGSYAARVQEAIVQRTQIKICGIGGYTVSDMITQATTTIDPFYKSDRKNICIVWGGVNDCLTADATTIYNRLKSFCQARTAVGIKVIVCTEIDSQDASRNAVNWHSTIMPALNALLAADHSWADGYADLYANTHLQDATNTTYFNADKTHLKQAGEIEVASVVTPIVLTLLSQ